MAKQEHIEKVEQVIWDWLQSHYQESCYTTESGKFTDALCDFWKIYNDNKDEIKKLEQQDAIQCDAWQKLSDENESLAAENSSYFRYNSVLRKENKKLKAEIEQLKAEYEQAKIDVLNKVKEKLDSAPNGWAYTGYIDDLIEEVENNRR